MRYQSTIQSGADEAGSMLVESAIALPVFLAVLLGIIQYGLLMSATVTIQDAAAVGAREAALFDKTCDQVEDAVEAAVSQALPVTAGNPTVTPGSQTVNGELATTVTVSYNYSLVIPFVLPGSVGGTFPIQATAVMRAQEDSPQCQP